MPEYKITAAFRNSPDDFLKRYWCDGVLLPAFEYEYSKKHVNDNGKIILTAFIGIDGQDKYEIQLRIGEKALSKFAKGLDISDCIQDLETKDVFSFDSLQKQLLIELL